MKATASPDPALRAFRPALLREPLFWAAAAAFVGAAVGLAGTFALDAALDPYNEARSAFFFAATAQPSGELLAALSLLGVPALLGEGSRTAGRRATVAGSILLLLLLVSSAIQLLYLWYMNTEDRPGETFTSPPFLFIVSLWISLCLPPLVVLPFAVAAFVRRRMRLGALLSGLFVLALPFVLILFLLDPDASYPEPAIPIVLGFLGRGVSLPEAPLWALLGILLFRRAHARLIDRASRIRERENLEKARRFYEEALGRYDLSVIDELVSEDFHDLRHGARGRIGMERVVQTLWSSFPDLSVSIEDQESEGDLVKTRLSFTGTDRGGVLWYPPTGRRAEFSAEFEDRFCGGELVEHGGETDTEELLRQLGHPVKRPV